MECYRLLLLSEQSIDFDRLAEIWQNSGCCCEKILNDVKLCSSCPVKFACVDLHSEENTSKWKPLNGQDFRNVVEDIIQKRKSGQNTTCSLDGAAQSIHKLADHLPYNGVVTVVWHFPPTSNMIIRSQMELFGALYRLVEWHLAKIYLVCEEDQDDKVITDWMEMLQATIVTQETVLNPSLWSGNVVITGTKSSVNLGGIELSTFKDDDLVVLADTSSKKEKSQAKSPAIMSPKMEVIASVPQHQVPSFYISEKRVVFHVRSKSSHFEISREFFKVLKEEPEICYIARLKYGESIKKPPKKDLSWQDAVIQQPSKLSDLVEPVELENVSGCHNFLLYQMPGEDEGCMAALLHPPSSLNGSLMQELALRELENSPPSESFEQVKDWVKNAPCASAKDVLKIEKIIYQAQVAVHNAWIEEQTKSGKDASLTADELLSLLELMRVEVTKRSKLWNDRPARPDDHLVYPLPNLASEMQDRGFSQAELLALQLKEMSQIEKGVLAPPNKSQQVTLDAAEFLKLFNKDGTSANGDMDPILRTTSPSKKLLRFNSNEKVCRTENWPACFSNDSHGKHYHNGEEAEKLEKVCNKLKARLLPIETAGFFSSPSASVAASKVKAKVKQKNSVSPKERIRRTKATPKSAGTKKSKSVLVPQKKSPRVPTPSAAENRTPEVGSASLVSRSAKNGSRSNETSENSQAKGKEQEKRSQRHKRKLEETVRKTLEKHDVMPDDPIYKTASQKLFDLVKCFLKGLRTSHNLRQEMETLAEMHAAQVIAFEKKYR